MATKSRRPLNLRQPVSCEPCRRRKIRCSRNGVPCDSCERRGCRNACFYLCASSSNRSDERRRRLANTTTNATGTSPISTSTPHPSNQELLARIQHIEALLTNKADQATTSILSPSTTANSAETHHPQSQAYLTSNSPSTSPPSQDPGFLDFTDDGFVTYRPAQTQWLSVLKGHLRKPWPTIPTTGSGSALWSSKENINTAKFELIALLPPKNQCSEILGAYFEVFSPLFHVLYEPFFHEQYEIFQNNPGSCGLTWLGLLYAILAIGVTALQNSSWVLLDSRTSRNALAERYRGLTLRCLTADSYMERHSLITLQALELLIYATNHSQGSSWALLGTTYHIALAIGCHVDPALFGLSEIPCEERRRAWAGLKMLYTIQNVSMGAYGSPFIENSVLPPADVDDSDLASGRLISYDDRPTQMSYLLFKFGLYELAADIAKVVATSEPSCEEVTRLDSRILHQQRLWDTRYSNDSRRGQLSPNQTMQFLILYTYSYQLVLLLHRPFFRNPHSHPLSYDRCTSAAMASLDIYKKLTVEPNFQAYLWYICGLASFYAFHAAAVLVAVLVEGSTVDDDDNMRNSLDTTLACFDGLQERSQTCEEGAKILRRILDDNLVLEPRPRSHASHDLYSAYNTTIEDIFDMFGTSFDGITMQM